MTYRISVFYDIVSAGSIFYEYLVAHRNVLFNRNAFAVNDDGLAFAYWLQAYDNRVGRIDFDKS